MANRRWRPRQTQHQKTTRWLQSMLPGAVDGEAYAAGRAVVAPVSDGGGGGGSGQDIRHYWEILKPAGEAPGATYQCYYRPYPYWPLVAMNNAEQIPSIDFTVDDATGVVTVLEDMDLTTDDVLWCRYNYLGLAAEDTFTGWFRISETSMFEVDGSGLPEFSNPVDYTHHHHAATLTGTKVAFGYFFDRWLEDLQSTPYSWESAFRVTLADASGELGSLDIPFPRNNPGGELDFGYWGEDGAMSINWGDMNICGLGDKLLMYTTLYQNMESGPNEFHDYFVLLDCSGSTPTVLDTLVQSGGEDPAHVHTIDTDHAAWVSSWGVRVIDVSADTVDFVGGDQAPTNWIDDWNANGHMWGYNGTVGLVTNGIVEGSIWPFTIDGSYGFTFGTPESTTLPNGMWFFESTLRIEPSEGGNFYVMTADIGGNYDLDIHVTEMSTDGSTITIVDTSADVNANDDYEPAPVGNGGTYRVSVHVFEGAGQTWTLALMGSNTDDPPTALLLVKDPFGTPEETWIESPGQTAGYGYMDVVVQGTTAYVVFCYDPVADPPFEDLYTLPETQAPAFGYIFDLSLL